jgi:hypothetical protein
MSTTTNKTPLMEIVRAAAARFDQRPEYRASVEARAELQMRANASQNADRKPDTTTNK